jgi:preprotein translocase subunit SecD
VTVFSLGIAAVITYAMVVLLGWRQGYRLSLPGAVGLIVAIGITADSFIVFFERVRDEVRDGKALTPAVEAAWLRARRTILISDGVSFLAAVVLYVLALGGVKGFAFTLGLTTLVDVLVVFLFTHPVVALLARTRFFGGGHKLSGFDAAHLGRAVTYTGRGTVRNQRRRGVRAPRPSEPSPGGARAGREKVSVGVEEAFVGAGSSPVRTGTTIAERRAAAERARRQMLLTESGDGEPDDEGPTEGPTSGPGTTDDARTGRRDD